METPDETRARIAATYGIPLADVPPPRVIPTGMSGAAVTGGWREQQSAYARSNAKRLRMLHLKNREAR